MAAGDLISFATNNEFSGFLALKGRACSHGGFGGGSNGSPNRRMTEATEGGAACWTRARKAGAGPPPKTGRSAYMDNFSAG
jgi:hypothetical protein